MKSSKVRILKIEAIGDFFRHDIRPRIRLQGHWLAQSGFQPEDHVIIEVMAPGELRLRSCRQSKRDWNQL
jgi:type I toxin-antitoxin system toxin SymE